MCKHRRPIDRQLQYLDPIGVIWPQFFTGWQHWPTVKVNSKMASVASRQQQSLLSEKSYSMASTVQIHHPFPPLLISAIFLFITCVGGGGGSTVRNFNIPLLWHCAKSYQCCGSLRIRINLTDPNPYYCNNSDPDLK